MSLPEGVWHRLCWKHAATKDKSQVKRLVLLSRADLIAAVQHMNEAQREYDSWLTRVSN
jgi:hypothetical protein